jgi:MFS family permease
LVSRRVLVAFFIDALGSGLLGPVELLYGNLIVGLPLLAAGVILSAAALGSIAFGPVAGVYVDRWGPRTLLVAANIVGAIGCAILSASSNPVVFGAASFLLAASVRMFWASLAPFVAVSDGHRHLERSFGYIRATRLFGFSLGGVVAAPLLALGPSRTLPGLVALDATSYVVAALLLVTASVGTAAVRRAPPFGSYRLAISDRANVVLAILNISDVVLTTAPLIAMPVVIVIVFHFGAGLIGVLSAESTVVVAAATLISGRILRGQRRLLILAATNALWLLSYVLMAALSSPSLLTIGLFVGLGVAGIAESAYTLTADALAVTIAPAGLAGRYTALHQMAWGVAESLVPALVALLIGLSVPVLWLSLAALAGANAASYVLLEPFLGKRAGHAAEIRRI